MICARCRKKIRSNQDWNISWKGKLVHETCSVGEEYEKSVKIRMESNNLR